MAELNCRCLNVTIHLDNSEVQFDSPVKPSDLLINTKKVLTSEDLYEVKLGAAGIAVTYNCLMQSCQSGDWIIHKCANCGIDTHITHSVKGDNKVFVTDKIETDPGKIKELRRSEKFSRVFNVVLSDVPPKDETVDQQRVLTMSFGNSDPVMKQLHQQMESFLNKEEAILERRIMEFEKEQREAFSRLCNQVHKERGLIFRSLAKAKTSAVSEGTTEEGTSQQEKGKADMEFIAKSEASPLMGHRNQSLPSSNNSSSGSSPGRQPEVTITLQDKSQGMISKEDGFEDALFGMDGMDDDRAPHFIQSDDDDDVSTSTDDSYREELTHSSHPVNVAHSLPITVPMFPTYNSNRQQQPSEHRDEKIHIAPSQMAESIKALALSVHQETEMFGDLPKPRTNSFMWAR